MQTWPRWRTPQERKWAKDPTFSGCVPLMPTHLAEGGYQAEKKGIRGTGRKVQTTRKLKSKGHTTKSVSKGAVKIPVGQGDKD